MAIDFDKLFNDALGGGGSSDKPADHMPSLREINGILYYWDPDNPTALIPLPNQPGQQAPFDDYGSAQYIGIDGPRGAVFRASNGQYVYGDQVFNSWAELNSILNASSPDAGTDTIRQGPDGQYYRINDGGGFELIPGMPAAAGSAHTTIQNVGGRLSLIDTQTGKILADIGPAGSGSSSGGSGGGSTAGLISGRPQGVNTGTGSIVSSSSYDPLAGQAAQRDWQGQQNELDRAQRAAEFAATYGLQAANYNLNLRQLGDQAAKTYGELVSSADTAALPAYLAAGGGNLWNSLATGNSMLTDNAIKPGAMALDNARYYQGLLGGSSGGSTGGTNMPNNPFDPPSIYDPGNTPLTQNPDGTVSHGGGGGAEGPPGSGGGPNFGDGRGRGGPGLGGGATGMIPHRYKSGGTPRFDTMPSFGTSPFWSAADAEAAFNGYAEAQAMQDAQRQPQQTYAQAFPTLYPGATFWQNGQLMYNTGSGAIPASMIDPYTMSSSAQGNSPYMTSTYLPQANQDALAADPRSINPNLNLSPLAQSNYVRPATSPSMGFQVNNGVQTPLSAAPNIVRRAGGGMIHGLGIVGDSPSGRRTGNEELVIAPRGAMVVPMNKIQGHAKGGAIDPFAPAGSSETAAAGPLSSAKSGGYTSQVEEPTPVPTAATPDPTPEPTATGTNTPLANVDIPNSPIAQAANPTPSTGMTIVNGPNNVPPGTPVPNAMSEAEVRAWRENFPIPVISGPYGALNPFDVAWGNVDPTARQSFYDANQTRYGIPAASQAWEASRFALPGIGRGGWGY